MYPVISLECERYNLLKDQTDFQTYPQIKLIKWEPAEFALTFLVLMLCWSWVLYLIGPIWFLGPLRYLAVGLAFLSWAIWEFEKPLLMDHRLGLFFGVYSILLVILIAWFAHEKMKR